MLCASKIDECGLWMMSTLTISSSVYSSTPFIGPSAASFIAALICSFVASVLSVHTRSTNEPVGVGTRTAMPSSLPLSSGITIPTAFAAPVVVGICDMAAERARRRSL